MAFRRLVKGLSTSVDDLEQDRLTRRFSEVRAGAVPIDAIPLRTGTRIIGEVSGLRVVPRHDSPWLEVSVQDGTGSVVAVFTGRRRIRGIEPGRALLLEGIARQNRHRIILLNPAYTLLP